MHACAARAAAITLSLLMTDNVQVLHSASASGTAGTRHHFWSDYSLTEVGGLLSSACTRLVLFLLWHAGCGS